MFAKTAVRRVPCPRLSRGEQREARKKEVLDAAWAVYLRCGCEGATMDAIAAQPGKQDYCRRYARAADLGALFHAAAFR